MIPFVDLVTQYRNIHQEIDDAVLHVLASGQYVLGPEVAAFEEEFAAYSGSTYCVALNTGTSALHLALLALGIGAGDEVITVPFTFIATAAAVAYCGATPVFVDIDPETYTMDPDLLEQAITPKTKAILPVHLYGQCADMNPILEIAERHGIPVIEDAAQAHGAEYRGRRAGSMGRVGCFSFYPGKNLGAYGEGGAITTDDPEIYRTVRMLRDWGAEEKYKHVLLGYNYRMDGIQGAILRVKLRHLEEWTENRRAHAKTYSALLAGLEVKTPTERTGNRHVYHVYAVRTDERSLMQEQLKAQGIQTGIHYPIPVHLQEAFAHLGHKQGDFPESERAADQVLSLPMYPELTEEQIHQVVAFFAEPVHG